MQVNARPRASGRKVRKGSWLCENALEEFRQTAIWANWVASRRKD